MWTQQQRAAPTPVAEALDARGIALATLLVMVFFVLSRVTGLAPRSSSAQFGTSAQLGRVPGAFRLPDILFQLVAGRCGWAAFIPTFAGYWVKDDRAGVAALLACSIW
ncbi:MAG: hypothetical protein R2838_05965 [Caldilineaceae bacterium]